MMTINQHQTDIAAPDVGAHAGVASFWTGLIAWFRTAADYYDAAATYEELARLSDAELARRGLSRDTLGRDVCASVPPRE
jgi:hypothetical protein